MTNREPVYKKYYTICLDVSGKPCVVCGGGDVARRKTAALKDAGAKLTVVSPTLEPVLEYMAFQNEIVWKQKGFEPDDIEGAYIVVAATDKRDVNHHIAEQCSKKDVLCNVVDEPDEGNYIVPTTIERGPFTLAIGTSGISPTLAASVRQELELAYDEAYGMFLELIAPFRKVVQEDFPSLQQRQRIYDRMVSSRAISLLRNGMNDQAEKEIRDIIYRAKQEKSTTVGGSLPIVDS